MNIQELSKFILNLKGLEIHTFKDESEFEKYCLKWKIHESQKILQFFVIDTLFNHLEQEKIEYVIDQFQIRFFFLKHNSEKLIIGPYKSEVLTMKEAHDLLLRAGVNNMDARSFLELRNQIPLLAYDEVVQLITSALISLEDPYPQREIIRNDVLIRNLLADFTPQPTIYNIEKRQKTEELLMDAIRAGDEFHALKYYDYLENSSQIRRGRYGRTIQYAIISSDNIRTLIRLAASDVKVHSLTLYEITAKNSDNVAKEKSIEAIHSRMRQLIKVVCSEVKKVKSSQYSKHIQRALYLLETRYDSITLDDAAEETNITKEYLISQFKKEVGITPNVYLNNIRLHKACDLLRLTTMNNNEICQEIGIDDPNYFSKLFKAKYNVTPTQYRNKHD